MASSRRGSSGQADLCTLKVEMSFVGPDGQTRNFVIEKRVPEGDIGQRVAFSEEVMETLNDVFWGPDGDAKPHQSPSERAAEALCRSFSPAVAMGCKVERRVEEIKARASSGPQSTASGHSSAAAAFASACVTVDSSTSPMSLPPVTDVTPDMDQAPCGAAPRPSPYSSDLDLETWRKQVGSFHELDDPATWQADSFDSVASNDRMIRRQSTMSTGGEHTPSDQASLNKAIAAARWSSPGMALAAAKWTNTGGQSSFPLGESFDTSSMTHASSCASKISSCASETEELIQPTMQRRATSMLALPRTASFLNLCLSRRQDTGKDTGVDQPGTSPTSTTSELALMLQSSTISFEADGTNQHAEGKVGAAVYDTSLKAAEGNAQDTRTSPTMRKSASRRSGLMLDEFAGNQTPTARMHRSASRRSSLTLDEAAGRDGPLDRANGSPVVMRGNRSPFANRSLRGNRNPSRGNDSPYMGSPLVRVQEISPATSTDSDGWHAKWMTNTNMSMSTNSFHAEPVRTAILEMSDEENDPAEQNSEVMSRILSTESLESSSNTFPQQGTQGDKLSPTTSSENKLSPAHSMCDTHTHRYGTSMQTSRAGSATSSSSRLRAMLAKAQLDNDLSCKPCVVISDGGCPYSQVEMIPEALGVTVAAPPPPMRISRNHGAVLR